MRLFFKKSALYFIILLFLAPLVLNFSFSILFGYTFFRYQYVFGYSFFVENVDSFYMTAKSGDIAIIRWCMPEEVQVGDIVAINPHSYDTIKAYKQTVRIDDILYELNGRQGIWLVKEDDGTTFFNEPIPAEQLLGKVVGRIPWLGMLININPTVHDLMFPICWGVAIFMIIMRRRIKKQDAASTAVAL